MTNVWKMILAGLGGAALGYGVGHRQAISSVPTHASGHWIDGTHYMDVRNVTWTKMCNTDANICGINSEHGEFISPFVISATTNSEIQAKVDEWAATHSILTKTLPTDTTKSLPMTIPSGASPERYTSGYTFAYKYAIEGKPLPPLPSEAPRLMPTTPEQIAAEQIRIKDRNDFELGKKDGYFAGLKDASHVSFDTQQVSAPPVSAISGGWIAPNLYVDFRGVTWTTKTVYGTSSASIPGGPSYETPVWHSAESNYGESLDSPSDTHADYQAKIDAFALAHNPPITPPAKVTTVQPGFGFGLVPGFGGGVEASPPVALPPYTPPMTTPEETSPDLAVYTNGNKWLRLYR